MKCYFDLFDKNNNHFYEIYEEQKELKTNCQFFNLRIFYNEIFNDVITSCNLIIEKEDNGNYVFNNKVIGEINSDKSVNFKNVEFKNIFDDEENYKIYFELKQGEIVVVNTKPYAMNFILNTKPSDFNISFHNAILLNDVFELQGLGTENVVFDLIPKKEKVFSYYVSVSPNETIPPAEFKPLNEKRFELPLSVSMFKDNLTYIHFFLKDNFNNVKYNKYKLTTKNGSLSLLHILNSEFSISSTDEHIGIFYESRNVNRIKPILVYEEDGSIVRKEGQDSAIDSSKKYFLGIKNVFGEIKAKIVKFHFVLNNDEDLVSNEVLIKIDSVKPEITLPEYKLIQNDYEFRTKLEGKIIDENFFFLGNSVKIINPITNLLLFKSTDELKHITVNGDNIPLVKYADYYYTEGNFASFIVNSDPSLTLNTFEERKHFYIWLDKNKLTPYEQNLLNQGSLEVKGDISVHIVEQECKVIDNIILIKVVLNNNATEEVFFDLGLSSFEYSFFHHINHSNISCEINNRKQLLTNFTKTNLIISKNEKNEVVKFNNKKVLSTKVGVFNNFINILAVSYTDEKFVSKYKSVFFVNDLNEDTFKDVYFIPKLRRPLRNNQEIPVENEVCTDKNACYICKKISDSIYDFELDLPIENGLEEYELIFQDSLGNEVIKKFEIEKNSNKISAGVDNSRSNLFNTFVKNDIVEITTREERIVLDFKIENEVKENKKTNKKITVKGQDIFKEQVLTPMLVDRKVSFSFQTTTEKQEYELFYEDIVEPIFKFSIQQKNELYLKVQEKTTTGLGEIFIPVEKDNFSKISVNYLNSNFNITTNNNGINIVRNNNLNITESLIAEINVFDPKNIYSSVSKTIEILFFNDNIIESYEIINEENPIKNNSFDIKFKLNNHEKLEYFRLIDDKELNFRNKFKYATPSNEIIIKNITTPLEPSTVFVEFKIKDTDLIVKKELFKENPIFYLDESKYFNCSISLNDKLEVKLNVSNKKQYKAKILINKEELANFTTNNTNSFSFDIDGVGSHFISVYVYNENNKLIYFYKQLIDFDSKKDIKVKIPFGEYYNITTTDQIQNIFVSGIETKDVVLKITNSEGKTNEILLQNGFNTLNVLSGFYSCELLERLRSTIYKKIRGFVLEVFDSLEDKIEYDKEYKKFNMISFIKIKNKSHISFDKLNPIIEHQTDKGVVKLQPTYLDEKTIQFDFSKNLGLNRFKYIDKYAEFYLEDCNVSSLPEDNEIKVYDVSTEEKALFYKNIDEDIFLEEETNVYFKTINADRITIVSHKTNNRIDRFVADKIPILIYKEFVPCNIEFYKNGKKLKELNIRINEIINTKIPIVSKSNTFKEITNFKIKSLTIVKERIQILMKNRVKHFLLNYTLFTAKSVGNLDFINNWTLTEQEDFIKTISAEVYNKTKTMDLDLIKQEIKKQLEDLNG